MPLGRKKIVRRSLVQHLTASLVAVVVASSIAISTIIFLVLYERSETQFEQRANEAMAHLSNSLESYLWHMEEESVVSLCETYTTIDIVEYIYVADHRENVIFSFGRINPETIVKERVIRYEDTEVGVIKLGLTPVIFREKVFETTWISLLSLLSVIVVLSIFTKMILNRNLRIPLGQLISRIEGISAGKYTEQVENDSLLEIQSILSKFNEMAEQVKQRENDLRYSEEKYRRLFETSTEGIVVLGPDTRITMVNDVLAQMLGYKREEMIGLEVEAIVYKDDLSDHEVEIAQRLEGHAAQYERRLVRRDGTPVWTIISSTPMLSDEGEFQGSFAMVTDISDLRRAQAELKLAYDQMEQRVIDRTEELNETNRLLTTEIHIRKQTEKEIIKAKESAEHATRAKSEFLANMSHEIRTPMNAIIGMTHLAKMTELTATQKDYLNKIDISARSLLGIINDVLDMSKIEAGMLSIETVGFQLDQVLEQLTSIVSPRANEKQLEFLINVEPDVPSAIVGDSMRLSQILINICNNAIKFTDKGSVVVSIGALEKDDDNVKLRFTVKDDGIGISAEQIPELFQPFTQADASTTRKYGGTGLGLNLCNQLVELMGGEIGVESELGKGSLFWVEISFPIYNKAEDSVLLPSELQGLSTLVVDDNPTSRVILKGMLEQMGLNVTLAKNGREALEILRNTPSENGFKLLVIDWRMPEMDGLETASTILSDSSIFPKPPMFMVSAYGNAALVKKTNEMGFKGLLFKPVNQSFLFNLVVETLGKGLVVRNGGTQASDSSDSLEGTKVLLVEDNEINRQVAQEILASVGIQVFEAFNGQEAIDFLDENEVDLVLMDIQMPIMDGHEATKLLRKQERFKDLPIIAMTAHAMVDDIKKSAEIGMNGHIAKPFDPDELFEILGKWVHNGDTPHAKAKVEEAGEPEDSLPKKLEGIDVELGLKRARGNEKLYRNLLLLLDEKYADAAKEIEQAITEGRREDGVSLAHSVKGTSGMLGAMELFEAASTLEAKLDDENVVDASRELEAFTSELDVVIGSISVIKKIGDSETELSSEGEESPTEELLEVLTNLKEPLGLGAPVECRQGAEAAKELVWPASQLDDVTKILKLIAEYDFKKALSLVEKVEQALS